MFYAQYNYSILLTVYARQTKGTEHTTIITLCICNLSNYKVAGNLYATP
jgi:hypothetical protein